MPDEKYGFLLEYELYSAVFEGNLVGQYLTQALQPSQPRPRILYLSYPRVSVLPKGEENANQVLVNIMSGSNLAETTQFITEDSRKVKRFQYTASNLTLPKYYSPSKKIKIS